jgi:hypothetical protein
MEKDNLLLSFPRSGNSWIRYFLEFISKKPTSIGTVKDCQKGAKKSDPLSIKLGLGVDIDDKCIAIKRHRADHDWDNWTKDTCQLIFLLRDYKEVIIRHLESPSRKKDIAEINKCIGEYIHCLKFYDEFDGRKCFLTYEDMLIHPRIEITKIIEFLGLPKEQYYNEFFDNFEAHRAKSVKTYHGGSHTGGDVKNLHFHVQNADPQLVNRIANAFKTEHEELYDKYLKRYG